MEKLNFNCNIEKNIVYENQIINFELSVMKRGKLIGSINQIYRKKRYEDYFDPEKTYLMTPHSRSLPKKKAFYINKKQERKKSSSKTRKSITFKR